MFDVARYSMAVKASRTFELICLLKNYGYNQCYFSKENRFRSA
jgi:hypothetical protein